jgi:hypothetical protein
MNQTTDWTQYAEAVAADIFGTPNEELSSAPDNVRFGNNGSVSINYTTGQWYDFENECGGGIKDLIREHKGIEDRTAALSYAEECLHNFENGSKPRTNGYAQATPPRQKREAEAIYPYCDASGQMVFEVVRVVFPLPGGGYVVGADGKRSKVFAQRRPSGEPDRSMLWGIEAGEYMRPGPGKDWVRFNSAKFATYSVGAERKTFNTAAPTVPYQLPALLAAIAAGQTICVAEGEKKVDLIRTVLGFAATCSAGGAKKWLAEHTAFLAGADVVLLPDNDPAGREHVNQIAEVLTPIATRVRVLELPNLPDKGDVVNWQAAGGTAQEFARLLAAAPNYVRDESDDPQPLMRALPPAEPFPLDALGDLAPAAQAICDLVQSPIEMCASAVLASTSFAISAHIDVLLPTGETKPASCWFWCVAESGERKTATDDRAFAAQKQREAQLRAQQEIELKAYEVRHKLWEAQAKSIEKQFKDPGAAGSQAHRMELEKLGPEPEKPLNALIMSSEFTFEGMVRCLNLGQPIYGIIGAEGGQFLGGHGMTEESKLRTVTGLSAAWDGEAIKRVRAAETVILPGRRVGMHLMIQPRVAAVALNDAMLNSQGFLSRLLVCAPKGLIGTRLHKPAPPQAQGILDHYTQHILAILERPPPLTKDRRNELAPRTIVLSADAKALYWAFVNETEETMGPSKENEGIKPLTAKLPEHSVRLAAAIAAYRDINLTELSCEDFMYGVRLANYYATEAKRISGAGCADPELTKKLGDAQVLLDWLLDAWDKPTITARDIYRLGPNAIRERETTLALAEVLVAHGWLVPTKTRRRDMKEWQIRTDAKQ